MSWLLAVAMAASISTVSLGALIGIAIMWAADLHGRHRSGRHVVRSKRTVSPSRGHRPYRGGRVPL